MIQALDMVKYEAPFMDAYFPNVDNASSMTGKDKVLLYILIARALVKRAGSDDFVAFSTDVLFEEEVAVQCEECHLPAAAEHYGAGDVVDTGALNLCSFCQNSHEI